MTNQDSVREDDPSPEYIGPVDLLTLAETDVAETEALEKRVTQQMDALHNALSLE